MAHDEHAVILRAKYGTPVHPRLRDGLLEAVDAIAARQKLSRNQTCELLIATGARMLDEKKP